MIIETPRQSKELEKYLNAGNYPYRSEADMLVLGQNPLTSLEALKDIRIIVNDGK